jgi:hypothetical protein
MALQFRADSSNRESYASDGGRDYSKLWEMSDMVKVLEDWEAANWRVHHG